MKKKRRDKRHRTQASTVLPTQESTTLHIPENSRPRQVIERDSQTKGGEIAERYRYILTDIKRSLVIGGVIFAVLIVLYLLLG